MNINRLALLTFVAAATLSGAALADQGPAGGPHGGPGFLKAADTNNDGVIDQTEFQAGRDKWFADLDANKDGFVTADELKAFGDKMRARWQKDHPDAQAGAGAKQPDPERAQRFADHILKRVDTDHDGKISKAEFDAEGVAMFKRLDVNADGKIAADEMPQPHWGRFSGRLFDRADTDHDGKITKAEFTAAGDQMFDRLDKNHDGVIEKDEVGRRHGPDQAPGGDMPPPPADAPAPGEQAPTP